MTRPVLPQELAGHFFGVGSVGEKDIQTPIPYIKRLMVPYAYQITHLREEDMIRQFGALIDEFEDAGDFILDIDTYTYRDITENDEPILIDEDHMHSLYTLNDGTHYAYFKTQQTAPATMGFSIRDSEGIQHLNESMFHFYLNLMSRVAEGQVELIGNACDTLILCQDDPGLGHVKSMIDEGKIVDLTLEQIIARSDSVFPDSVIPAFHFCDDWRALSVDGWHALWDGKPKLAHIDLVRYDPSIDEEQAEQINAFLKRGGGFALGVLPNLDEAYERPLMETLRTNIESAFRLLRDSGVDLELVAKQSMISTQCGLSGASEELTREVHSASLEFPNTLQNALESFYK